MEELKVLARPKNHGLKYIYLDIDYVNSETVHAHIDKLLKRCEQLYPEEIDEIENVSVRINIVPPSDEGEIYTVAFMHVSSVRVWQMLLGLNSNGTAVADSLRMPVIRYELTPGSMAYRNKEREYSKYIARFPEKAVANREEHLRYATIKLSKCFVFDPPANVSNCELVWNKAPNCADCELIRSEFLRYTEDSSEIAEYVTEDGQILKNVQYPIVWKTLTKYSNTCTVHVLFSNSGGHRDALFAIKMCMKMNFVFAGVKQGKETVDLKVSAVFSLKTDYLRVERDNRPYRPSRSYRPPRDIAKETRSEPRENTTRNHASPPLKEALVVAPTQKVTSPNIYDILDTENITITDEATPIVSAWLSKPKIIADATSEVATPLKHDNRSSSQLTVRKPPQSRNDGTIVF